MNQKKPVKEKPRGGRTPAAAGGGLEFGTRNYAALGAALAAIAAGFALLAAGSITAAPILLVLGYCVLVPYGLAAGSRRKEAGE